MCGRFTSLLSPELLKIIFSVNAPISVTPRYNIAPSQTVTAIRQDSEGHNQLFNPRWGLIPSWSKDTSIGNHTINARAETVHEKPAFRHAIRYRRCIIPASGFYEWVHKEGEKGAPLYIHLKDEQPMCFAGIWEHWKPEDGPEIESCSIITTSSNTLIKSIHDRMPVILHPGDFELWLNRNMHDPEQLKQLYQPYPADLTEMYPVSPLVNSPRNTGPECIKPLPKNTP